MLGRSHTAALQDADDRARRPKWTRAVHTQPPILCTTDDGQLVVGSANIQCWRGTVNELHIATAELVQSISSTHTNQNVEITWADGSQQVGPNDDWLCKELKARPASDLLSARLSVNSEDEKTKGNLVIRAKIPALEVEVTGSDRAKILGATEMAFQQMMIGYVDRIGGWRLPAWMLTALMPTIIVIAIAGHISSMLVKIPLFALILIASIVTMGLSYEALLVRRPLKIESKPIPLRGQTTLNGVKAIYRHPITHRIAAIIGALIIGIAGSKLANLIP